MDEIKDQRLNKKESRKKNDIYTAKHLRHIEENLKRHQERIFLNSKS